MQSRDESEGDADHDEEVESPTSVFEVIETIIWKLEIVSVVPIV